MQDKAPRIRALGDVMGNSDRYHASETDHLCIYVLPGSFKEDPSERRPRHKVRAHSRRLCISVVEIHVSEGLSDLNLKAFEPRRDDAAQEQCRSR